MAEPTIAPYHTLPLEIQQRIINLLDVNAFAAVRQVSRSFRAATRNAHVLRRQLRDLPIWTDVVLPTLSIQKLDELFVEATNALPLNIKTERSSNILLHSDTDLPRCARICVALASAILAGLKADGRSLFDPQVSMDYAKQCIEPTIKVASDFFKRRDLHPCNANAFAISSSGYLFAIRQKTEIRIYDIRSRRYVGCEPEWLEGREGYTHISSMGFEDNDRLLRVTRSDPSSVLYVGTPSAVYDCPMSELEYWGSTYGLSHTCLDDSLWPQFRHSNHRDSSSDVKCALTNTRLLRPFEAGHLFMATITNCVHLDSTHLNFLGYVQWLQHSEGSNVVRADPESVTILARCDEHYNGDEHTRMTLSSKYNIGCTEPPPRFVWVRAAMSPDRKMMAMLQLNNIGCILIYRVPSRSEMSARLKDKVRSEAMHHKFPISFDKCDERKPVHVAQVVRLPLRLERGNEEVSATVWFFELDQIESAGKLRYELRAMTDKTFTTWRLVVS